MRSHDQRIRLTEWVAEQLNQFSDDQRKSLETLSGVNVSVIDNVRHRKTKMPQGPNLEDLLTAMGKMGVEPPVHLLGNEGAVPTFADGIPLSPVFDYEKDVIKAFSTKTGPLFDKLKEAGLEQWPDVEHINLSEGHPNPIPKEVVGHFKEKDSRILVDARPDLKQPQAVPEKPLTFLEAGPREWVYLPRRHSLRAGIVICGGMAPAVNAILDGVVERLELFKNRLAKRDMAASLKIYGYQGGVLGLLRKGSHITLSSAETRLVVDRPGCLIGTSRAHWLERGNDETRRNKDLESLMSRFQTDELDMVFVVGGDGTMKLAHALYCTGKRIKGRCPSIIGIPKTMDNNLLWLWQSPGFQATVARATEFVRQLYVEAESNPRLAIVQLYGADSGFMVSHAALASRVCDEVLIPEVTYSMESLRERMTTILQRRATMGNTHGMIVMAETAIPSDASRYVDAEYVGLNQDEKDAIRQFQANSGQRVQGHTPEELGSAALKIVSRVLQQEIRKISSNWEGYSVITSQPRHLVKAVAPTGAELIFGHRLGTLAVDTALAGHTDCMISHWLTEYVVVPLRLVVLGRKRVKKDGMFWRAVVASTDPLRDTPEHDS